MRDGRPEGLSNFSDNERQRVAGVEMPSVSCSEMWRTDRCCFVMWWKWDGMWLLMVCEQTSPGLILILGTPPWVCPAFAEYPYLIAACSIPSLEDIVWDRRTSWGHFFLWENSSKMERLTIREAALQCLGWQVSMQRYWCLSMGFMCRSVSIRSFLK